MSTLSPNLRLILNTFVPQRRHPDPAHAIPEADRDLRGKTVVFTGGTDGMGRVAVESLYRMGADVLLLGRLGGKGPGVADTLGKEPGGTMTFVACDLASMNSVKACAEVLLREYPRIDVLVNCAGANVPERRVTEDGFEANWAVNFLAPFLLTSLLVERVQASAPARIVNLSSETEAMGHIDLSDLAMEHNWGAGSSYARAKLAVNMFTIELAAALEGTGVTVNALNPGFIHTNLLREMRGVAGMFRGVMKLFASPPEVGADRIARLAISSEFDGISGVFVSEDTIREPNPEALDAALRRELLARCRRSLSAWLPEQNAPQALR